MINRFKSYLECKKNVFYINRLKDKFIKLEKKYFQSDSNRQNKITELEEILLKKQDEKNKIRKMLDVYENCNIEDMRYNDLLELKKKVGLSLDLIKIRKQKSDFN